MDRGIEFERMDLEDGQRSLLEDLVEADRLVEAGQPKQFVLVALDTGFFIIHPSGGDRPGTDPGDVRALTSVGLLRQVRPQGAIQTTRSRMQVAGITPG